MMYVGGSEATGGNINDPDTPVVPPENFSEVTENVLTANSPAELAAVPSTESTGSENADVDVTNNSSVVESAGIVGDTPAAGSVSSSSEGSSPPVPPDSRFRIRGLPRVFEKGLARGIFFALLEKRNMDSVRATRRKTHGDLGQGRDASSQGPEQKKEHRP